jgi:ring-1,2-phenylacetyl-CoA epoxidase subunit PaaE
MVNTHFFPLRVQHIQAETADTATVAFDIPADLAETFRYVHGQYLTLRFTINGSEVRRAYSICTSPSVDKTLAVSIKRVNKGLVSNYIHDKVKVGDTIEVMPPQGRFTVALHADHKKDYYLFGAGSGITPLMSILKSVLEEEPKSRVFLLYGNRDEDGIIFHQQLQQLEKRYSGQFFVSHVLSQPKQEKAGGLAGLFKKPTIAWKGLVGRIDAKKAIEFIEANDPGDGRPTEYFLCGPSGMMETIEQALKNRGADDKHIHAEWFTALEGGSASKPATGAVSGAKIVATLGGKTVTATVQAKESILDAIRREGHDAPFSCMAGACATCMAKVKSGTVTMDSCFALDDSEIKQGLILTCQAHPTSDEVELTFDI